MLGFCCSADFPLVAAKLEELSGCGVQAPHVAAPLAVELRQGLYGAWASGVVVRGLSCSVACGIFLD